MIPIKYEVMLSFLKQTNCNCGDCFKIILSPPAAIIFASVIWHRFTNLKGASHIWSNWSFAAICTHKKGHF